MKIAFYTSTLGDVPIEGIVDWAAGVGFDGIEIDVNRHIPELWKLEGVLDHAKEAGLEVCSMTLFGNLLDPREKDKLRGWATELAAAAIEQKVPHLVLFPGRDQEISENENYHQIAEFLEELISAKDDGTFRVALENWPGKQKDFIATTPDGWAKLFSLTESRNIGLEFDPSHLIWQGIDPHLAAKEFANRIFLLHGKDTILHKERLQKVGYLGPWWEYKLPGLGMLDWGAFLRFSVSELRFDGWVSIEHEDRAYAWPGGNLERRKEGLVLALQTLRKAV